MESGEVKKCYEWRTGFRSGQVECYLAETETTVYFESGSSVPKDRLEFDLFQIDEEIYLQKNKTAQIRLEQQKNWESFNQSSIPIPLMPSDVAPLPIPVVVEKSPIQIILDRNKKKENKSILISVSIDMPNEKVVDLLTTMFDEDEVYSEIIQSSLSKYSYDDLKKLIEESIIKLIKGENDKE